MANSFPNVHSFSNSNLPLITLMILYRLIYRFVNSNIKLAKVLWESGSEICEDYSLFTYEDF